MTIFGADTSQDSNLCARKIRYKLMGTKCSSADTQFEYKLELVDSSWAGLEGKIGKTFSAAPLRRALGFDGNYSSIPFDELAISSLIF